MINKTISWAKRKPVTTAIAVLILLIGSYYAIFLFGNKARDPSYAICTSTSYRLLVSGMNQWTVTKIMGEPDRKLMNQSLERNFLGLGERGSKIKEAWIYRQKGHATAAEIYFGHGGRVNGKGCGQG